VNSGTSEGWAGPVPQMLYTNNKNL
jgi:hypothetical protein